MMSEVQKYENKRNCDQSVEKCSYVTLILEKN